MFEEFKEFAMRGNVLDLAIAVIMGVAFGKIVSSFVADVMMPPLGLLSVGMDFTAQALTLKEGATPEETVTLYYGNFIQAVVDFLLVSFAIFLLVKAVNATKKKKEAAPTSVVPSNEEKLLTEIRDLLKNNR